MAKRDYYEVLGIAKGASDDEIRSAYRALARKLHPDVNKSPDAQAKFTEVQEAYDTLSDEKKRRQYDYFGHDAERMSRTQQPGGGGASGGTYSWSSGGPRGAGGATFNDMDVEDLSSVFESIFGGRGATESGRGRASSRRGGRTSRVHRDEAEPLRHTLDVDFMTAALGGTRQLQVERPGKNGSGVRTIEVKIPPGIANGAQLRVRGALDGHDGDIILTVRVAPHPVFRRGEAGEGTSDLFVEVPVTFAEAALGATISIPTLTGSAEITIPAGSSSGRKLRLRGQGIAEGDAPRGDLYAVVKVVAPMPADLNEQDREALRRMSERLPSPRTGPGWKS